LSFLIASGHVEVEAKTDKALSAITGLVGALGAVGPVAGVAAAGLAAAGAGVAAFGVAAGKQIVDLKHASDAQGKYQTAVDKSGKHSQDAAKAQMEVQKQLAKMPKATQEASAAFTALKDSYSDWSDALAGDTMPVFTHSFQLFQALLPKTTGLVKGTSVELDRLVTVIAGGVNSPGFDSFMVKLTDFSQSVLHHIVDGVIDLSRSLGSFTAGGGFDSFIDTAREAGPILGDTLVNLAKAVLNLAEAGGDVGISLLTAANALAKLVNAVPPEVLSTFMQLYTALKLISVSAALVNTVITSTAVANMRAYFAVMRTAGVGATLRATAGSMSTLTKVAGGLGILGAVAIGIDKLADKARGAPPDVDKLVTSLKTLATTGEATGELKASGLAVDDFITKLGRMKGEQADLEKGMKWANMAGLKPVLDQVIPRIDSLVNKGDGMEAIKDDFKSFDEAFASMVNSGYADQAATSFKQYEAALKGVGYSQEEINKLFPEYTTAVAGLKADNELAAQGMGLFGQQAMDTKNKLNEQKTAADGLRASIVALNDVNRANLGGMIGFEASIDAAAKAAKENAGALKMVNGELDLNSPKAQAAATALSDLGAKTDAATTAALEANEPWEKVNTTYERGRSKLIAYAQQMGLSKAEATKLADEILKVPAGKDVEFKMKAEDAIADLDSFMAAIKKTPDAKSVTLSAITKSGEQQLEALGYKVKHMPDGSVTVTAKTGGALGGIGQVQAARDRLSGKSITVSATTSSFWNSVRGLAGRVLGTSYINVAYRKVDSNASPRFQASGGPIHLAGGGTPNGRISGPGTSTSDSIPAMLSDGEWVIRAAAVDKYGDAFMQAINTGRFHPAGFAKGGKTKKLTEKQKAELQRRKEARNYLTDNSTLTDMSHIAGVKNAEISSKLGKERSEGALVDFLNGLQNEVTKAGFSKKTTAALQKQITATAKKLFAQNDAYDKVTASLEKAKSSLEDLKSKFDSLKTSVSSSLVGFANITKIGKYGTSADTLINQLRSDTGRTTEFAKQLDQLKKKGLNAQSLSEIAEAGVAGGGMATAQSLLNATPAQIDEINRLEKQLKMSADKAGTTTADAMYGAGIKAAEGLVKGLTSQQAAIEASMMAIAKSMEKAIKKALGIKSPSKVMEAVGDFSMQGVEVGWVKRMAKGRTLLTGNTGGLRVRPALLPGAAGAAPPSGASVVVHLNPVFNTATLPAPADRKAFAVAMAKDINDALLDYQKARRR